MSPYEFITLFISITALLLSIYSTVSIIREKNIKPTIHIRWYNYWNGQLNVCILVSNMSSRPATITSAHLITLDGVYESTTFPCKLTGIGDKQFSFSDYTPLNIAPRSSQAYVIAFQFLRDPYKNAESEFKDHINIVFEMNNKDVICVANHARYFPADLYIAALEQRARQGK